MQHRRYDGPLPGSRPGSRPSNPQEAMTRMRAAFILMAAGLIACTPSPEQQARERLVGAWRQTLEVFGEQRESILTFRADGTFEEATRIVAPGSSLSNPLLTGTWAVAGQSVALEYRNGFTGDGAPEKEVRRILRLDATHFVSADARFGLVVERERVAPHASPSGRERPGPGD